MRDATLTGRARPLVTIRSDDVMLLALPWELIHHDGRFLVRDGVVDLVRTDARDVGALAVLRPPAERFALVVNVSAPEGSGLDYETRELPDHPGPDPALHADPDRAGDARRPGRDGPAGRADRHPLLGPWQPGAAPVRGRRGPRSPGGGRRSGRPPAPGASPTASLPPFFYLANCHGNDPAAIEEGRAGVESLAARLHREGVAQVVAYSGPILDVLSTEAEAALYAAIADGQTTRFAVRQAREALGRPIGPSRSVLREVDPQVVESMRESYPFAWSQLVLYHRGPDHPLSQPVPAGAATAPRDEVLAPHLPRRGHPSRSWSPASSAAGPSCTGCAGRSARASACSCSRGWAGWASRPCAFHTLKEILHAGDDLCTLWCQDAEKAETPEAIAEALVGQLLEYCRRRFGLGWEGVVQQVDRAAGADPAQRFRAVPPGPGRERPTGWSCTSTTWNRCWSARRRSARPIRMRSASGARRPCKPSGRP